MFVYWGTSVVKFLRFWLCIAEVYYIGLANALFIAHHTGLDKVAFKITQPFLDDVAIYFGLKFMLGEHMVLTLYGKTKYMVLSLYKEKQELLKQIPKLQ